jgi:flagellar biosynthesis chaperone FliJ
MRPEVITALQALDNKNSSAIAMEKKTLETLVEQQDLQPFINELSKEIRQTKDAHDDRVPFYNFCLAITLLKHNNIEEAKDVLADAMLGFRILGWTFNEAIGEWLFSTIHFEDEDYERAQRACDSAITKLRSLIKQYNEESKYESAKELSTYLLQLNIFQDTITTAMDSFGVLKREHTKLKKDIEYSTRQNKIIRPTVVAKNFYLTKILTPAHYIYPPPPESKTEREESIYTELLNKVGFSAIIEQLESLEKRFAPTATREELLDRINKAWDEDIKR